MPLTEDEKQKVKFHLGYPLTNEGSALAAGIPISIQPMFLVIGALDRVPEAAIPMVQGCLAALDKNLQLQRTLGVKALIASQLEDLTLRPEYLPDMRREYRAEQKRLSQIIGAPINPDFDGLNNVDAGVGNATVVC